MLLKDISYLELWRHFCSVEQNHLCNFNRGYQEKQFCEFIFNLDKWLRRCLLKIFLIWRSGGCLLKIFLIWNLGSKIKFYLFPFTRLTLPKRALPQKIYFNFQARIIFLNSLAICKLGELSDRVILKKHS